MSSKAATKLGPWALRTVLVPLDLTPGSEAVLSRLCRLPLAENARVTLLHVVPRYLPAASRKKALEDARYALAGHADRLAAKLSASVALECEARAGAAAAEIGRAGDAGWAQLIVMGRRGGSELRDLFIGSTAEQVVRGARLPVLVVRDRARHAYRRPLLAASGDELMPNLLAMLLRLVPPPRPPMAWVHAFDAPFRGLIYPSLTQEQRSDFEKDFERRARATLSARITAARLRVAPGDTAKWRAVVLPGSPRRVIPNTVSFLRADLLAMGTQAHGGLAHALLGTVAGDVLRDVSCDVLVVPRRRRRS